MSITPLGDRVFVKRHEPKQKTSGGILLPDSAQKKLNLAEIVAVGEGAKDENGKIIPLSVKAGDIVLIAQWGGTDVKYKDEEYLILKESDILAIVAADEVQNIAA